MENEAEHPEQKAITQSSSDTPQRMVWDCGSSLYDSFELKAFEKQLDAAIAAAAASRAKSMPHISDRLLLHPLKKKPTSKIKRSLLGLIPSAFRRKSGNCTNKNTTSGGGFVQERPSRGFNYAFSH